VKVELIFCTTLPWSLAEINLISSMALFPTIGA
jgi:hypothetical protein